MPSKTNAGPRGERGTGADNIITTTTTTILQRPTGARPSQRTRVAIPGQLSLIDGAETERPVRYRRAPVVFASVDVPDRRRSQFAIVYRCPHPSCRDAARSHGRVRDLDALAVGRGGVRRRAACGHVVRVVAGRRYGAEMAG